jgi:hypothetical protein
VRLRSVLSGGILLLVSTGALATTRTLVAVANVQGQALFQSDVRVFNPSYTATITVTAIYHCTPCTQPPAGVPIMISPRQAKAYNDAAISLFNRANTQGAVEFETDAADLVVTSRLYSNSLLCQGSVGQFVPGLEDGDAFPNSVLTSLQQSADFRTNIVLFNPSSSVNLPVKVQVFDGATQTQIGGDFNTSLSPKGFFPSSNLFNLVGATAASSANAYAKVTTDGTNPVFAAASVLDNHSQDTIFIKGEADLAGSSPTGVETIEVDLAQFSFNGGSAIVLQVGHTYVLRFHATDDGMGGGHGFSGIGVLGLGARGGIRPGQDYVTGQITPTSSQVGTYAFHCITNCGAGHGGMYGSLVVMP